MALSFIGYACRTQHGALSDHLELTYISQEANISYFAFRCSLPRYFGGHRPAGLDYPAFEW